MYQKGYTQKLCIRRIILRSYVAERLYSEVMYQKGYTQKLCSRRIILRSYVAERLYSSYVAEGL